MKYIKLFILGNYSDFRIKKAIEIIGENDNKGKRGIKQKPYKNGISILKKSLLNKNILVTKRELKVFANIKYISLIGFSRQRISANTVKILAAIYEEIHKFEELVNECSNYNEKTMTWDCKKSLFFEQEKSIIRHSKSIDEILETLDKDERNKFETMFSDLIQWTYNCP